MGAFVKTTKVCAIAALGLGLSLGIAVSAGPSVATASTATASHASSSILITSPTEIDENTPVEFAGTAKAGSTLQVLSLPDGFLTKVEVDEDGTFSHRTVRGFSAGVHRVTVLGTDRERVDLDIRVRGADGTVPTLVPLSVDEPTAYVPGEKLSLSGRATPGARVQIVILAVGASGETTVQPDGTWSFESPSTIGGLEHEVRVRQDAPAGSDEQRFSITAEAPSFKPLTVDEPSYVPGQKVRLSGTATPNGAVTVSGGSAGIHENVTAGADGKWSVESVRPVTGLQHQVRVRQTAANDAGIVVNLKA